MDHKTVKKMFDYCGIDQKTLQRCLKEMGASVVGKENLVVTECIYHFVAPYDTKVRVTHEKHPFLIWPNGFVVDLLNEGRDEVDYEKSLELKMKKTPSPEALQLAKMLELNDD